MTPVRFEPKTWSGGYKTFVMLCSAETEIYPAHKYHIANNFWHFNIYQQGKLQDSVI